MIEFVSYSGTFPNLCSGILTVRVDGREVRFGCDAWGGLDRAAPIFPQFWRSGGCCGFDDDWNEIVGGGPWMMDASRGDYPPEIFERLPDILAVMNANVEHGCCGGCI